MVLNRLGENSEPNGRIKKRRRLRIIAPQYPAFNIYSGIARITTALGPVTVATAVHEIEGWDVEVIDENNYRRAGRPLDEFGKPDHRKLQEERPADLVGLYGGLTSTIPRLYEIARFYGSLGVPVIAGGQHFMDENIPEALENGVDIIVLGEGEETIKELIRCFDGELRKEEIAGLAFLQGREVVQTPPRPLMTGFEHLPVPDFSLIRYAKIIIYPVGRVRGCGMDCEFCTVKGKARYGTPEYLMAQISSLHEIQGARQFFIVDDLFGQDRLETLRLCRLLRDYQRKVKARFRVTVQIRLDKAKDTELLKAMREAGIIAVAIGFESPIAEELQAMDKRLKPEEMIALSRTYSRAGFFIHGMFIFGYPMPKGVNFRMGATERVQHFRKFIRKAKIDTIQVLLPVPAPGTELTARLRAENRVFSKEYIGWEYYDGNFPLFVPDEPMTPEDMQNSLRRIMGKFYHARHMVHIALHILAFPALLFYLYDLEKGWKKWTRRWRNVITKFEGWLIFRKWIYNFARDKFSSRLAEAKRALAQRPLPSYAPEKLTPHSS
jgi:radical SAM superfamily enzyme YgiQ (UPF0313 family)